MIKLKTLISESIQIGTEISSFEKQLQSKYRDALEQLHFYYDTLTAGIFLSDIYIKTPFRGKGYGTKIMKELCAFADKHNLPISLIPAPESLKAGASRRLEAFYRRFGFGAGYGLPIHNADDMAMVRMPKKALEEKIGWHGAVQAILLSNPPKLVFATRNEDSHVQIVQRLFPDEMKELMTTLNSNDDGECRYQAANILADKYKLVRCIIERDGILYFNTSDKFVITSSQLKTLKDYCIENDLKLVDAGRGGGNKEIELETII